jgi:general secretion pathway protein K
MSRQSQRGVALIIVLWIVTLLTLVASSFIYAMRTDIGIVANTLSRAKAIAVADAAIQRATYELFKPGNIADRWNADGTSREWSLGDTSVTITMTDESGKLDINTANELLMRGFLQTTGGLTEEEAATLTDAIGDWRDADSLKRLRGAEEPEYVAAGLKYKPANAPFLAVEELKRVLGMTPQIYARLAPYITIYSRGGGVNWQIAPRQLMRAIPGVTEEQIETYIQQRDLAIANKQPVPLFTAGAAYPAGASGFTTRVVAEAHTADDGIFVREAVVMRVPNPKRMFAFLLWREAREPEPAAPIVSATPSAQVR